MRYLLSAVRCAIILLITVARFAVAIMRTVLGHARLRAAWVAAKIRDIPPQVGLQWRKAIAAAWSGSARFRWLLNERASDLTAAQRLQRKAVSVYLGLPDRYFRRHLTRLGVRLAPARTSEFRAADRSGVLMMIGSLGPGGAERQVAMTLQGLQERGLGPVRLACCSLTTPAERFFLAQLEARAILVNRIGAEPVSAIEAEVRAALLALPGHLHSILGYAATLAAARPSVAHLWLDEINIKGGIAAVATGVPRIVLGLRSLPPCNFVFHQPYMREGYRWLARQPGVTLICNSTGGARAYERWLGLPEGVIGVVRNGLTFDATTLRGLRAGRGEYRKRMGIPGNAPVVGTIFRMSEEKRPLLWLEIAAGVRRAIPDARFLIVGDGPLREAMERRARREDLNGAVHFAGYESQPLRAVVEMDLFLLTSRAEGLPNVLIEAQAAGVPALTTPVGGAPETVEHGRTGVVLESAEPREVAAVLVRLLRDTAWRSEAAERAPAFVQSAFGLERALDETIAAYDGALAGT
jgi:glycosyltransferase involved in cell wall biosynthesis